nr:MAG TPA: hypothetical protein [Caudoviricetes sp.]
MRKRKRVNERRVKNITKIGSPVHPANLTFYFI